MKALLKNYIKSLLQITLGRYILISRTRKKGVSITFDDGPHIKNTPMILDALDQRHIKGTFFVLGSQLKKFPELGNLIISRGHELGNHTYDHLDLKRNGISKFHRSVGRTEKLISKCSDNKHLKMLRIPFGIFNSTVLLYTIRHRYLLVGWTVDSRDSFIRNTDDLVEYLSGQKVRDGDIMLFHEDYSHTVEALPDILDNLIAQGIRFVPIRHWYPPTQ